jgi:hypothetical protein
MVQNPEQNNLLDAAETELNLLLAKKAEIAEQRQAVVEQEMGLDSRINFVCRTIKNLALIYGGTETLAKVTDLLKTAETVTAVPTATNAVRDTLQFRYPNYLPPTTVRQYLTMRGVEVKGENQMAVIHQVLRRLEQQGWAESKVFEGRSAYRQKRPGVQPAGRLEATASVVMTTNPDGAEKKSTTLVGRPRKRGN